MTQSGRRDDARYRREFLVEAEGLLEQAQDTLLGFPGGRVEPPPEALNALFRSIHSMKGLAAMTGFPNFAGFSHELESLLDAMRMGRISLEERVEGIVIESVQALGLLAARIQAGERDPEPPPAVRDRIREAVAAAEKGPVRGQTPRLPPWIERTLTEYERHRLDESARKGKTLAFVTLELPLAAFDAGLRRAMDEVGREGELIGTFPGGDPSDPSKIVFRLLAAVDPSASLDELASRTGAFSVLPLGVEAAAPPSEPPVEATAGTTVSIRSLRGTVRVPLEKLGNLLDLAIDLSFSRWALKRSLGRALASATDRTARFEAQKTFTDLDRTVTALGRAALATRLVPVEQLTARLSRVVASLAPALGKDVEFEVYGAETEVDKVLAEELADPLLHIVRNALDHGIEPPDEREKAGKPRRGKVGLTVETRGRTIVFTLSDDGRGIEGARLIRHAREKGILRPDEPDPLNPTELIFRPGFSTAEKVSELSGRGVGLDVVRANLETLKGNVRVTSRPGAWTTFEVEVPTTLVLVESLLVRAEGHFFAFPTAGVRRAFRAESQRIRKIGGHAVLLDEGVPLSIHSLGDLLGLDSSGDPPAEIVVVAEQGDRRAGFTVSSIEGMEDVIVKPLSDTIPRVREVTGATVLPGGGLALTLDTGLLLERALAQDAQSEPPS